MKPNFKTFAVVAAICMLGAGIGCNKDSTTSPSTNTSSTGSASGITSLQAFYKANGVPSQSFTINNSTGATIKGANGGKYFFPANFFVNSANQAVSGNVNVQLKEIFTPANMILSNMPTVAGNRGLLSDGEFNITATQNNKPLKAGAAMFVAHLPVKADSAIDSVNVWNFNNNTWGNSYGNYAYALGPDSICINSDSINWLNADYYYPGASFYQLTINAPNAPNISQTCVYIYVNGHKAIWQTYFISGTEFQTPSDIPASASLTIVGICTASDGTLYSFFYPYTNPGKNDNITVNFTATTTSAFTATLQSLH